MRSTRALLGLVLGAAAAGPAAPVQAGLIAFYPFESGAIDVSGNGHDGVVTDATTTTGFQGQAYLFNGTSAFIHLPTLDINPSVYPKLTIGAFVRPDALTGPGNDRAVVLSHDNGLGDRTIGFEVFPALPVGWFAFAGDRDAAAVAAFPTVPATAWAFLAAVYDQAAKTVTVYVDLDASTTEDALQSFTRADATLGAGQTFTQIGRNPIGFNYYPGAIDNVFVYDEALDVATLVQIRALGARFVKPDCGNQLVDVGEQCDDGNLVAGDGCSDTCQLELPTSAVLAKCQTAIANGSRAYVAGTMQARADCLLLQLKGKVGLGADCRADTTGDPATDTRVAKAQADLGAKLASRCAGIALGALGYPGECPDPSGGAFTTADLHACLVTSHDPRVLEMLGRQFAVP